MNGNTELCFSAYLDNPQSPLGTISKDQRDFLNPFPILQLEGAYSYYY